MCVDREEDKELKLSLFIKADQIALFCYVFIFLVPSAGRIILLLQIYIIGIIINLCKALTVQIPGGVTAAKGFKAAGMYGGLRAVGEKPDLALVTCDVSATSAGQHLFC